MFKSKYRRKYEQIVSDLKWEIEVENSMLKCIENDIKKLEERGINTEYLKAERYAHKSAIYNYNNILKRAKEV